MISLVELTSSIPMSTLPWIVYYWYVAFTQ